MGGDQGAPMTTSQVCLYGGMPVLYMVVPVAVQVLMIGSMGSVVASTFTIASLVVGWSVRMFERFCLDGWHPMNAILRLRAANNQELATAKGLLPRAWYNLVAATLTFAAAVASPTAHLHFWTGITLLMGYVHARSLDMRLL